MSNGEILSEIGKAMSMMADTKSIVNEALCHAQNIVKKYNEPTISEDTLEMERMKALNEGRNEVWELANKIQGLDCNIREKIYGIYKMPVIFEKFTPQEALAKLEAYEKEQNEIKVGDVVEGKESNTIGVVMRKNADDYCHILFRDGSVGQHEIGNFKKTGKHIDIQSVLEQIKE